MPKVRGDDQVYPEDSESSLTKAFCVLLGIYCRRKITLQKEGRLNSCILACGGCSHRVTGAANSGCKRLETLSAGSMKGWNELMTVLLLKVSESKCTTVL